MRDFAARVSEHGPAVAIDIFEDAGLAAGAVQRVAVLPAAPYLSRGNTDPREERGLGMERNAAAVARLSATGVVPSDIASAAQASQAKDEGQWLPKAGSSVRV